MAPVRLHHLEGAGGSVVAGGLIVKPALREPCKDPVVIDADAVGRCLDRRTLIAFLHHREIRDSLIRVRHAEDRCEDIVGIVHHLVLILPEPHHLGIDEAGVRPVDHTGVATVETPFLVIQIDQRPVSVRQKHVALLGIQIAVAEIGVKGNGADVIAVAVLDNGFIRHAGRDAVLVERDLQRHSQLVFVPVDLCGKSVVRVGDLLADIIIDQICLLGVHAGIDQVQHQRRLHRTHPELIVLSVVMAHSRFHVRPRRLVENNNRKSLFPHIESVVFILCDQAVITEAFRRCRPRPERGAKEASHRREKKQHCQQNRKYPFSSSCQSCTPPLRIATE